MPYKSKLKQKLYQREYYRKKHNVPKSRWRKGETRMRKVVLKTKKKKRKKH